MRIHLIILIATTVSTKSPPDVEGVGVVTLLASYKTGNGIECVANGQRDNVGDEGGLLFLVEDTIVNIPIPEEAEVNAEADQKTVAEAERRAFGAETVNTDTAAGKRG